MRYRAARSLAQHFTDSAGACDALSRFRLGNHAISDLEGHGNLLVCYAPSVPPKTRAGKGHGNVVRGTGARRATVVRAPALASPAAMEGAKPLSVRLAPQSIPTDESQITWRVRAPCATLR